MFFIVLDLRLTKGWSTAVLLFLCLHLLGKKLNTFGNVNFNGSGMFDLYGLMPFSSHEAALSAVLSDLLVV